MSISRVSLLNMARASRKHRPNYATNSSQVRRNAKREAARGAAGEWEGPADELEWEGAGELGRGANDDFASKRRFREREGALPPHTM